MEAQVITLTFYNTDANLSIPEIVSTNYSYTSNNGFGAYGYDDASLFHLIIFLHQRELMEQLWWLVPAMVYAGQKRVLGKPRMVWKRLCIRHGFRV